jgi:hypothetical protein
MENLQIKHSGFESTLKLLKDKEAGLLLTDLPYGVSKKAFDAKLDLQELNILCREARRVLKDEGSLFSFLNHDQINDFTRAAKGAGFTIVRNGVWVKSDSIRRASPYPISAVEHWMYASSYGDSSGSILPLYVSSHAANYKHFEKMSAFRKPVSLLRTLVLNHSKAGDLVIDPFGGSGSTGVAALLEGRRALIGDIDAQQIEILTTNLNNFEAWNTSKPLKGFLRGEKYAPDIRSVAVAKARPNKKKRRKKRDPKRAVWSHDDRKAILNLLYQHSFCTPMTGAEYYKAVSEFSNLGDKLTVTQLRSVSYRLIDELGPIEEGELALPSFAFDATAILKAQEK